MNCKLLRTIKSSYQVNETSWYTIKCTLQTHLCHNTRASGFAPGPGEAGMLPHFFFFPQTIQPVTSLSHNRSAPFYRVLTVVFQYSFGMVTAHYKDECYLIWQDFSEGCTYISMGKPVYCILLGQTAADPLIAEPTWTILHTISIYNHHRINNLLLRLATLLKSKDILWGLIFNTKCIRFFKALIFWIFQCDGYSGALWIRCKECITAQRGQYKPSISLATTKGPISSSWHRRLQPS